MIEIRPPQTPRYWAIKDTILVIFLAALALSCSNNLFSSPIPTPKSSDSKISPAPPTSYIPIGPTIVSPVRINPTSVAAVMTPSPSLIVLPTSTPTAPLDKPSLKRSQYVLSANLDYDLHYLTVSQVVTYVNQSRDTLTNLLFIIEPNRQPGVFHLKKLNWGNGQPIQEYTFENTRLDIPLSDTLSPGASVGLSLSFELNLPNQAGPFGYTSRQVNLGDWYPFLPPYRDNQGWLVHDPAPVGEYLAYEVVDYQVDIRLTDPTSELTVAAGAIAQVTENRYQYQHSTARNFALSVSPDYRILTKLIDSVTVASYFFPEHLPAGEAALTATADALAVYSDLFGPYPHGSLAIVEADFTDGMEYDGLYFLGEEYYVAYDQSPQGYLTIIAVHETAHQWWYGLVGNDQAISPWLDESLATYSELLFYEARYPHLTDWWWEFRVHRFRPTGWVSSTIYDHNKFRPYVNAVYLRGALFVAELRNLMGDESFSAFLRDYATQNVYAQVTSEEFFTLLAEHSSADFTAIISSYFSSGD